MGVFQYFADSIMVAYYTRELAHGLAPSEASRCADALVRIGVPAVPALIKLVNGDNLVAQWAAGAALGKIGARDPVAAGAIVPVLVAALKDDDGDMRRTAARAIGEIAKANPDDCVFLTARLVGMLDDANFTVRLEAVNAIGRILFGSEKAESIALLEEKLREGAASLTKGSRSRDDVRDAIMTIARILNDVAMKKNELARAEMKDLMLSGERPKPPKGGGMYRTAARARVG